MSENRWLSADEIAEYVGVKRDTIYKWIERHDFPAHKAGRLWKFRKREVDEWLISGSQKRLYSDEEAIKEAV